MAINFPNTPIDGNTYDYQGIRYTYKDTGGGTGYWRVTTPGTVSIASVLEIDTGLDPIKYFTPLNFASSKYASIFGQGTEMLFRQTAAPTGWTKVTTHDNKALRVVSGTVGSGGTKAFSTVFGRTDTGSHALALSQIPSHRHLEGHKTKNDITRYAGGVYSSGGGGTERTTTNQGYRNYTDYQGGGEGHTHPMDNRVQYVDIIIASKD